MALTATVTNIEASLNQWLMDALDYPVVFNVPRRHETLPAYSVHHHVGAITRRWQHSKVGWDSDNEQPIYGRMYEGIIDISCWASRRDNNWALTLRTMATGLQSAIAEKRVLGVSNYENAPIAPEDLPEYDRTAIRLGRISDAASEVQNPDYERRRFLLDYSTTIRALGEVA